MINHSEGGREQIAVEVERTKAFRLQIGNAIHDTTRIGIPVADGNGLRGKVVDNKTEANEQFPKMPIPMILVEARSGERTWQDSRNLFIDGITNGETATLIAQVAKEVGGTAKMLSGQPLAWEIAKDGLTIYGVSLSTLPEGVTLVFDPKFLHK